MFTASRKCNGFKYHVPFSDNLFPVEPAMHPLFNMGLPVYLSNLEYEHTGFSVRKL